MNNNKTILTDVEVQKLMQIKNQARDYAMKNGSPNILMFVYDQIYLPINNILADHGACKYDDGQIDCGTIVITKQIN